MSAQIIPILTFRDALALSDGWQAHAQRLEIMLALLQEQKRASDLLLEIAQDEVTRLRGIVERADAG